MAKPQDTAATEIRTIGADQVFVERMHQIRGSLGLSVAQVAERLAGLGRPDITAYRIRHLLKGTTRPHLDLLFAIADALGIAPLALMTVPEDAPLAIEVAPGVQLSPVRYNAWVCGLRALPGDDEAVFAAHPPRTGGRVHRAGAAMDQALTLSKAIALRSGDTETAQELLAAERDELLGAVAGIGASDLPPEQQRAINVLRRSLGLDTDTDTDADAEA
jgi:transcriptional regulator with XRE-family HTH domain